MGSIERKIKRQQLKQEYKKFGKAYTNVKGNQLERIKDGKKLDPGEHRLFHRPSFNQYKGRVEEIHAQEALERKKLSEKKLEEEKNVDREWKEE